MKVTMDDADQTKSMPVALRLQIRIIKMAQRRFTHLGLNMPKYISQLIVKDNEGG